MDSTQIRPTQPTASRAILITLLISGCINIAFIAGIFAGVVGDLALYHATGVGAGAFLAILVPGMSLMRFAVKADG
ncbi:hypothetical protein ACWDZW_17535 [Streptomyces coeruleorubidus]